jgi:hypothetical protein
MYSDDSLPVCGHCFFYQCGHASLYFGQVSVGKVQGQTIIIVPPKELT